MPKKTEYKPEYAEQLYNHLASGLPFDAFGGVVGVCRQTLYNWLRHHVDFQEAKDSGYTASYLFWMQQGIKGLWRHPDDLQFNATHWYRVMKNLFGWRDSVELTGDPKRPLVINPEIAALSKQQLHERIEALIKGDL